MCGQSHENVNALASGKLC